MPSPSNSDPSRRQFLKATGSNVLLASMAAGGVPLAPPDKQPPNLKVPSVNEPKKLGYAIVGLGQLALGQILPAFATCEHSRPTALVSGHPDKAKAVAAHYHIDSKNIYNYDNYDEIKNNQDVDVIYIVLPNSMHAEYTIRGFHAGKHVLCEKPMAVTPDECRRMIDAGKQAGKKLMIAYRLHFEPYNQSMIEMSRKQAYGPIRIFTANNDQNTRAPNIRLSKSLGGGPLGDVGVYCLNASRYILGEEPAEVTAMKIQPNDDPRFAEVPATVTWQLRFPSGAMAINSCSFDSSRSERYRVTCTEGWYELEPAFGYGGQRLHIGQGRQRQEILLPYINHFTAEMDHLSQQIMNNKESWTPGEEGLRDIEIMAKIEEAAETGKVVKI